MGEMGKGEMGTAHAGKPPSLPRELRTPLVLFVFATTFLSVKLYFIIPKEFFLKIPGTQIGIMVSIDYLI
jgi:hypothetical protein